VSLILIAEENSVSKYLSLLLSQYLYDVVRIFLVRFSLENRTPSLLTLLRGPYFDNGTPQTKPNSLIHPP